MSNATTTAGILAFRNALLRKAPEVHTAAGSAILDAIQHEIAAADP